MVKRSFSPRGEIPAQSSLAMLVEASWPSWYLLDRLRCLACERLLTPT